MFESRESVRGDAEAGIGVLGDVVPSTGTETRLHCANCIHCKLVPTPSGSGRYRLRVRCDAGKWRKPLGEEKIYKYFTVARRSLESCDAYEDMGEADDYLRDLRTLLPTSDEEYGS